MARQILNVTEEIKIDLGIKVGVWNFNISYFGKKKGEIICSTALLSWMHTYSFFEHKITDSDLSADARSVRTYKLICQIAKNCDCGWIWNIDEYKIVTHYLRIFEEKGGQVVVY